jgi:predicted nucleic acid-binding protein
MTLYLLDSDTIIDYLAGQPDVTSLLPRLDRRGDILCSCDVVIAEVYAGLLERDRSRGEEFLLSLTYLDTTMPMAKQAGEWRYAFARRGISLSTQDCLIAGTAHGYRIPLLTTNLKEFPMPEIQVISARQPWRNGSNT